MPFFFFLLLNATLFIRPGDLFLDLATWPIYNVLILCCFTLSFPSVLNQLNRRSLAERPVSALVVGLFGTLCLSTAMTFDRELFQDQVFTAFKVLVYYFCLTAIVDTPAKLRSFLKWLVVFIVVLTTLALLQYHELIDIPALAALKRQDVDESAGKELVMQLRSTGMYNDPNDLCTILVVGIMISLYFLFNRESGFLRVLALIPLALLGYAVLLTKSRGGLLSVLGGLFALFIARFGWKRAIPLTFLAFPAILLLSGGRQTELSVGADTAQDRMLLWSEGLQLARSSPKTAIFGIGSGRYADEVGQVAHNSYVHAFVEMGLLGGTLFVGVFYVICITLYRLGVSGKDSLVPESKSLRPFLLAAISGYAVGMFSLSRCYIVPTYTILGLACAYFHVAVTPGMLPPFNRRMFRNICIVSIGFQIFIQIFIRFSLSRG